MNRPRTLTAAFVRAVNKPGRYGDGRGGYGLSLLVRTTRNGRLSKTWSQRLYIGGKPAMVGLGSYPIVTLAEARAKCVENRRTVEHGRDLRSPEMPTVAVALEKAIATREQHWRNPRTAKAWRSSVHNHAAAIIARRVDQVSTADVLAVLNPVWTTKPELGRKLRQRLAMAFRWAVAANHISTNPAGEALAGLLPRHAGTGGHFDSLPASEVPAALDTIDASAAFWSTKAAIRMLALTATRSSEVRGMRWDEIHGDVWTIPADRTKTAIPQRVPLSSAALAVLDQARIHSDDSGYVFPNRHGNQTTVEALSKLCRDQGLAMTPHGLRSSFRSWCAEQGITREVAEMSLGHTVRGVEGAYQRSDLLDARAEVMEQWGQYLSERLATNGRRPHPRGHGSAYQ